MSIPGFTAHAALRSPGRHRYAADATDAWASRGGGISPQNIECEITIRCINGIRYQTIQCSDGSGSTKALGPCWTSGFDPPVLGPPFHLP